MRFILTIMSVLLFFLCIEAFATSPPFTSVTISGKTNTKFNKVSLFESGSATEPYKSEEVLYYNGKYRIRVDIPSDMRKKNKYYSADMRFWGDTNENGIKDEGEPVSECHFIIWVPSANQVYMQVYKGEKHTIESPYFKYYYK